MSVSRCQRLALTENHSDTEDYTVCLESLPSNVTSIWLSDGKVDEKEGLYYVLCQLDPQKAMIYLYILTFIGDPADKSVRVIFDNPTRVAKILFIDSWCAKNRGEKLNVNYAMTRPPPPLAASILLRFFPENLRDFFDERMRMSVAHALRELVREDRARSFCQAEKKRFEAFFVEHAYFQVLRSFIDFDKATCGLHK